jgi:hypothetical protein
MKYEVEVEVLYTYGIEAEDEHSGQVHCPDVRRRECPLPRVQDCEHSMSRRWRRAMSRPSGLTSHSNRRFPRRNECDQLLLEKKQSPERFDRRKAGKRQS